MAVYSLEGGSLKGGFAHGRRRLARHPNEPGPQPHCRLALLKVSSVTLEHPRWVSIGMHARDGVWKGGLLIDCVVALLSGAQLLDRSPALRFDNSDRWLKLL